MLNNSANSDYKDIEENEMDAEIKQGLQISSLLNNSITSLQTNCNKIKINQIGNVNVNELVNPNSMFNSSLDKYYQIMDTINIHSNNIKKEINSTKAYISNKYIPNTKNYEKWDLNDILFWIKLLENGRFIKYLNVLSIGFKESNICGKQLPDLCTADLSVNPFNIAIFKDKRDLINHFKSLPHNDNNTQEKKIRIYVDGCWDVMHSGHYNAIRQAKALGDILVVGVHSDAEIARNKREPVMKNEQRMAAVSACKWVDEVVFGVPYSPSLELLDKLNCDYVAHGDDIAVAANGHSAYHTVQDKLKIFRRTPGVSTTHLIQRLLDASNSDATCTDNDEVQSWSSFLASSSRISAFSNNKTPTKDDIVVYIDGIFDLFHIGHIAALKKAKELGTFLYVGLYNDKIVRARKGVYFPLMGLQERVLNVLSCKYVDDVLIGCPWKITSQILKSLNIRYVVITPNTKFASNELDRYDIPQKLGLLKEIKTESDYTTDMLMQNIVKQQQQLAAQNVKRVEKAKEYVDNITYIQEKIK